jgi:CDGSH-type Zn-finger protein
MATHSSEERLGKLRTEVKLEPGETVALCRCFKSGKFPFCDGSHKKEPGRVAPVIVSAPPQSESKDG